MTPAYLVDPDWETTYRDNVVPVYRFVYAHVGTGRTPKTSPPRYSSGRFPAWKSDRRTRCAAISSPLRELLLPSTGATTIESLLMSLERRSQARPSSVRRRRPNAVRAAFSRSSPTGIDASSNCASSEACPFGKSRGSSTSRSQCQSHAAARTP